MIETKHFRLLKAIDEVGTVSGAARALGYSQPAITQQLQTLERRLETVLLTRSKSGARLTEVGRVLLRHANTVLNATSIAETEVAAITGLRAGNVRLTAFPSGAGTVVSGAVSRMGAAHPGVNITMVEAEPPRAMELLRSGDVDMAIVFTYSTEAGSLESDFLSTTLMEEELQVVLNRDHPLTQQETISVRDLEHSNWIAGCPDCRSYLLEACRRAGFDPQIAFETDDYVTLQSLAARGVGVAILPDLALSLVQVEGIAFKPASPRYTRRVSAVFSRDMLKVPTIRETLRALQASANELVRKKRAHTIS